MDPCEQKELKKERRRIRGLVRVFQQIWGPGIEDMHFDADHPINYAELILHELAHQTLLPSNYVFSPGRMDKGAFECVQNYITELRTPFLQDLHEIKACAIELTVSNKLGLGVDIDELLYSARINTKMFKYRPEREMKDHIMHAMRLKSVQFRADTILFLFGETKRKKRERSRIH